MQTLSFECVRTVWRRVLLAVRNAIKFVIRNRISYEHRIESSTFSNVLFTAVRFVRVFQVRDECIGIRNAEVASNFFATNCILCERDVWLNGNKSLDTSRVGFSSGLQSMRQHIERHLSHFYGETFATDSFSNTKSMYGADRGRWEKNWWNRPGKTKTNLKFHSQHCIRSYSNLWKFCID